MRKAIFFESGAVFLTSGEQGRKREINPETLAAMNLLKNKDYLLVFIDSSFQDYIKFITALKKQGVLLTLFFWNGEEKNTSEFLKEYQVDVNNSFFITQGEKLKLNDRLGCKSILVLSGKGYYTLNRLNYKEIQGLWDVCKNVYNAVFSIVYRK